MPENKGKSRHYVFPVDNRIVTCKLKPNDSLCPRQDSLFFKVEITDFWDKHPTDIIKGFSYTPKRCCHQKCRFYSDKPIDYYSR